MSAGLTPIMAECLKVIGELSVGDVPPTYEQIRARLGLASRGGVSRLLTSLKERGFITFERHRARSIQLTDPLMGKTGAELRALRARIDRILMERGA